MGLLLVAIDDHDSRLFEPTILVAVDGRVGGFMLSGARRDGAFGAFCTTDRSDALVPGRELSCRGGGLFGSSFVGGGGGASIGGGCLGGSFAGGEGGLTRERPSFACVVCVVGVVGVVGVAVSCSLTTSDCGTVTDRLWFICAVSLSLDPGRANSLSSSIFIARSRSGAIIMWYIYKAVPVGLYRPAKERGAVKRWWVLLFRRRCPADESTVGFLRDTARESPEAEGKRRVRPSGQGSG